jgi:copper chaperone CopZ
MKMQAEKSNNDQWVQGLHEFKQLPDQDFDKNNAWEKLHDRLGKKNNKKRPALLWWAAASVAAAVVALLLLNSNNGSVIIDKETATGKNENDTYQNITPAAIEKETNDEKAEIKNLPGNKKVEIAVPQKQKLPAVKNNPATPEESLPQDIVQAPENISDTNTKTAFVTLTAPAETKKKLRVVHNNELGYQPTRENESEKKAVYAGSFIPGKRRIIYENTEDNGVNNLPENIKPKKSILHFGSFISQKQ